MAPIIFLLDTYFFLNPSSFFSNIIVIVKCEKHTTDIK